MSVKACQWASRQTGLSRRNLAVLKLLARHHNGVTGRCDPSTTQLAAKASCAVRTVKTATAELERAGLITKKHRYNRSIWYTLNFNVTVIRPAKPAPEAQADQIGGNNPQIGGNNPQIGGNNPQIGGKTCPLTVSTKPDTRARSGAGVSSRHATAAYKEFEPLPPQPERTAEQTLTGRAAMAALRESFR